MDVGRPRCTVAIPLHRSLPFVDVVSANIERLPADDVEILVSDRTGVDGAFDELRARHGSDPRLRFVQQLDGIGWVDHYNALLRTARGELMMWMPHDDDFPDDYVPLLRAALDARPDALIAFGDVQAVHLDGSPYPERALPPPPITLGTRHHSLEARDLGLRWNIAVAFRGLMRRDELLRRNLTVRHTRDDSGADWLWMLGVAMAGPLVYEPRCHCVKRFYEHSTHARWAPRRRAKGVEHITVATRYAVAARVPPHDLLTVLRPFTARRIQLTAGRSRLLHHILPTRFRRWLVRRSSVITQVAQPGDE